MPVSRNGRTGIYTGAPARHNQPDFHATVGCHTVKDALFMAIHLHILSYLVGTGFLVSLVSAKSQGVVYISNLGATTIGTTAIASDAWLAQPFKTGSSTFGYSLDLVQLLMAPQSGAPRELSASLYNNNGSHPGSIVASLTGPAGPSAWPISSFSCAGLKLLPATTYWIVLKANSPFAEGAYYSTIASFFDYTASDNWSMDRYYNTSANGQNWAYSNTGLDLQFSISAIVIPEPVTAWLMGFGGIFLVARHRVFVCTKTKPKPADIL